MLKLFKRSAAAPDGDPGKIPNHLAFICDGNRRWAKTRGLSPLEGHRAGVGDFNKLIDYFVGRGVSTLTFFIFSTENWNRSDDEVSFLMKLFEEVFDDNYEKSREKNLRFRIIGRRDRIPAPLLDKTEKLEKETLDKTGGTVVFALDYGGQDEIVRAANAAIENGEPVDIEAFESFMDTGDLVPIDMVIRTSNERRISNFLLWKLAYAEFFFVPEHWPEFVGSRKSWDKTLDEFASRTRRFGGGREKNYSGKK
ncbi:MAG: di-trans,poly-cis-decaprenylcistransferase [Rickettsiales bacterium]|jgi:undecaprenyl diphosphate synthase|nr:di-trans,poly-cis-decaprenylcistransferase [Rickettsiales bacterium]